MGFKLINIILYNNQIFLQLYLKYWTISQDDEPKRDSYVSEIVQNLYREMQERIQRLKITPTTNDFKLNDFMIQLECYICTQVYTLLFCTRF